MAGGEDTNKVDLCIAACMGFLAPFFQIFAAFMEVSSSFWKSSCLLGLTLFQLSCPLKATAQISPFQLAGKQFLDSAKHLNYVAPLQALRANKAQFGSDTAENSAYSQALATYYSFVGQLTALPVPKAIPAYRLVPAAPLLAARARATSVVILNEAHSQPRHRAYCRQLLAQLAPLGYHYFAVEALDPDATGLNERKFPLSTTGFYTCEPSMGNLLRAATETGFHVFGHELKASQEKDFADWRQRSNYRDSMQAVNILAVLRAHPQAKLVALVGYDHVREKEAEGLKRLATYLRELGHLDPLTIDQTQPYPSASTNPPLVLATAAGAPVVMGQYYQVVDMQVIHPPTAWVGGRPGWLATSPPITAAIPAPYRGHPALAQLYDQAEYAHYGAQAIPLDQYLTTTAQQRVVLYPYKLARKTVVVYQSAEGL